MRMKRAIYEELLSWKEASRRKPLILRGARQVGKSYILSEFGSNEFPAFHHFDFEKDGRDLIPLFDGSLSPEKLIQNLAIFQGRPIAETDLIIFDEIQSCPRALTSLKYFCEEAPHQPICAAGSLLGVAVSEGSYPVGKVGYLDLYPMSFEEFLLNSGQDLLMEAFGSSWDEKDVSSVVHAKLWETLKQYYVVGGMPEAVSVFFQYGDRIAEGLLAVRKTQAALLNSFLLDFTKHSGVVNAAHIAAVFEDVPRQLSGYVDASVKRYRFKDVLPGKRGFVQLEGPIGWLEKAGLLYKVPVCQRAELPLDSFCKANLFKLFVFDTGLLGCMLELSPGALMTQEYGIIKGFFAENFVANEFMHSGERKLFSWMERNSEIEFLLNCEDELIPVEVKAGVRTKAQSLRQYFLKYEPRHAVKISGKPLTKNTAPVINIPLYYSGRLAQPGSLRKFITGQGGIL